MPLLQRKEASNKTFDVQAIYAEAGYDPTTPVEETQQNISTENKGNPRINKTNKFSNNKFQDKKPLFVQAQEKYDEKKAARWVHLIYNCCWSGMGFDSAIHSILAI